MMLKVTAKPNIHKAYGFSMQVQNIELVGEGSIKRAAELLQIKLTKDGLFDVDKKRQLPYPPSNIGLITSAQSAAYQDFIKIIGNRWRGVTINLIDVQVQGEVAASQIVEAIEYFNNRPDQVEVLVIIRGGGSPEDLAVFSLENVTRSIAASKIPTLVAIGHEIDVSLAELAADRRASTPSHAAEVLVPDKRAVLNSLKASRKYLLDRIQDTVKNAQGDLKLSSQTLNSLVASNMKDLSDTLRYSRQLLEAYNPRQVLERGYAIIRKTGQVICSTEDVLINDELDINLSDGLLVASVKNIKKA